MRMDEFLAGLQTTLGTVTGKQWGMNEPPASTPTTPYGIMYPMVGGGPMEGVGAQTDWLWVNVQLTSIGVTPIQAAWLQDKVMRGLVGPSRTKVTVGSVSINTVFLYELGPMTDAGQSLFSANDSYRFGVPVTG